MSNANTKPDTLGINMHISTPVAYILSGAAIYRELFGVSVSDATQNCQFGEQTLHGYARPFRTLNGELLHLSHLRCLIVVGQAPFLTGSSQGLALYAVSLILPKRTVLLLQIAGLYKKITTPDSGHRGCRRR